jgi:hypothetical protein
VQELKTEMDDLRADRNALTHGVYQGKSKKGELFFAVASDLIFDKAEDETAYKLRVFTHQTIIDHLKKTVAIGTTITTHFDAAKMIELRTRTISGAKSFAD